MELRQFEAFTGEDAADFGVKLCAGLSPGLLSLTASARLVRLDYVGKQRDRRRPAKEL